MANDYGPGLHAALPDTRWEFRACIIRFAPGIVNPDGTFQSGGPYIHVNSGHIAVGAISVHVEADGDLAIDLDGGAISSIQVTPDETLTTRGIWFGPSGAASATVLRCYKVGVGKLDLSTQAGWNAVAGDLSNAWLLWATCSEPGTGQPSKADQALAAIDSLQDTIAGQAATIEQLQAQVNQLQGLVSPGSFARLNAELAGQTFADFNAAHAGQTFAEINAQYEQA
ncbi:MAG TPA: hypothetical protein VF062_26875 [Candidatus Limnocylindrales bacterium]